MKRGPTIARVSYCVLEIGAIAVALTATYPLLAQEQQQAAQRLEEVVVTGSRIVAPNMTSTSPIQAVTSQEIELTGKRDISDVLYQLPQNFNNSLGQDFSNRTSGLTTAGGLSTADLRGLGPQRTLVLIDGRRLGPGDANTAIASPAPNLDQIPTLLVERVDVVTGGASAVYGSDAIAGVVNFITKKNFQGLQLDYQIGENWHNNHNSYAQSLARDFGAEAPSGHVSDGRNKSFNILAGTNFADDKGNLTAYLGYLQVDPVTSGARDFGACQLNANATLTGAACSGSSNSNYFAPTGILNATTGVFTQNVQAPYAVVGNQFLPWPAAGQNPPALFNSQRYIYISRGDQRYTTGFMAHIDLTDYAQPYAQLMYMNDKTHQEIAPSALFRSSNPLDPTGGGNYNINCSNPLLSAQQQSVLCTPAEIAADAAHPGSVLANVDLGRRNIEGGGRSSDFEHSNYRAVVGVKGGLLDAWNYDAYGSYYYTSLFNSNDKYLSFQNIGNALIVSPATGKCVSGGTCVPYNIFQDGGVTQDALNYLYLSGTAYGTVTERIYHTDLTGQLGTYGLKSPLANDGVAVNIGYEHRSDKVEFRPDSGERSGLLSGFGGASVSINNGESVDEEFIEVRAPIAEDKPFMQDLVFDTGFRHSDYNTIGAVNTHKFGLQWSPIRDVRFRGSFQRAIRAPSIIELYNPQLIGQITIGEDPCAPSSKTGAATASFEQCARTGVTAAQYGNGIGPALGGTNTIPQGTASQLSQLQGGNPKLTAERANTYTLGLTVTPSLVPDLTASIDYYHIELTQAVGTYPATVILQNCLNTGDPTFCSQLVRSPANGGLNSASVSSGGYIVQTSLNVGANTLAGIDLQAGYKRELPGNWGSVSFALAGTYMLQNQTTPYKGAHTYNCAGLFGASCQTVNPRWRHNLRTTWATPWDLDVSLQWRFIGKVGLDNNDRDPTLNFAEFGAYNFYNAQMPNISYLDLSAIWRWKNVQVRGGINNILDKDPPLVTSEITAGGAANSYETYDTLGRQAFVGFTVKF